MQEKFLKFNELTLTVTLHVDQIRIKLKYIHRHIKHTRSMLLPIVTVELIRLKNHFALTFLETRYLEFINRYTCSASKISKLEKS